MTPVVPFRGLAMSVVVPTHGRADLFLQTLASLERQRLSSFEVIVTDDSPAVRDRELIEAATRRFAAATHRAAEYVFIGAGRGQARNTNQGLARARGEFVRILHSDDLLAPNALESEVRLLSDPRLNLELLYHLVEPFSASPQFDRQPVLTLVQPALLFRSTMHSSTPLPSATAFRRDLLTEIGGGMREDFNFLCDWELLVRLIAAQHRRHRFIGRLTQGYVGWRVHPNSTTGRLWHRHFLEHEQMMAEMQADERFSGSIIGDRSARDGFFACAVRYRYARLWQDAARMTPRMFIRALPQLARCASSPRSLRARLRPAPWSWLGGWRYPRLTLPNADLPGARATASAATLVEPRAGLRFALNAYLSAAVVGWGKSFVARRSDGTSRGAAAVASGDPALVNPGSTVDVHGHLGVTTSEPGTTYVLTDYNNSTNVSPLRELFGAARRVVVNGVNANAFHEPVLHQLLKFTAVGAEVQVPLLDNHHLTSFGFKALLERQSPGQFGWTGQTRTGPSHAILNYRRQAYAHPAYLAPHTGWTFGMLTSGTRLANVVRFIESIEASCHEPYEVLIVAPTPLPDLAAHPHVRVIVFTEHDDLGWITRKKNLIGAEARFSDILVCHDRFSLDPEFIRDMRGWGFSYGLAAPRVRLPDGRRGLDWAVVSSQNQVWSNGGLLDYRAYSQYAYNPGGATLIRKAFWRDFPWNENLFWNEHEDVELCRRIQHAGGIIALTSATLIAAEDRWVEANPQIPYCEQNEVLYGGAVGEQRIKFLRMPGRAA
jgi:glycosyltransferase involved in cell wall biosynthesis